MVASLMSSQQATIIESISSQISSLVEKSVEASLARLNINSVPQIYNASSPVEIRNNQGIQNVCEVEQRTLEQLLGLPSNNVNNVINGGFGQANNEVNLNRSRLSFPTSSRDLSSRPDKVSQIITNWKIKFNGSSTSLPVDNFIYRVEALTTAILIFYVVVPVRCLKERQVTGIGGFIARYQLSFGEIFVKLYASNTEILEQISTLEN